MASSSNLGTSSVFMHQEVKGPLCLLGQSQKWIEWSGWLVKKPLRAWTMTREWAWPEWTEVSTALLAVVRESVMMIMCLTSKEVALTTPSRIANNSASRAVAHSAGTLDDDTCSPSLQKWATETACIFLGGITLASVATTSIDRSEEASWQSRSRASNWSLRVCPLEWSQGWKETWSGKLSNNLHPGCISGWSELKCSVRLRSDASVSRRGLLNRALYASVRRARDCGWGRAPLELWALRRKRSVCWEGSIVALRQDRLANFLRWRWIGMRPARASIPPVEEVQKVPRIQRAALRCMDARKETYVLVGAPKKYQSQKP